MDTFYFTRKQVGYGQWLISYTKRIGAKSYYRYMLTDAPLYDACFNTDSPKESDLKHLRHLVLTQGQKIKL